jgi:hypothetical protein
MGKLERLAAARERVREWKAKHPKSVEWQRKRWYARKKGERKATVKEAAEEVKSLPKEYPHYGETHTGWVEGVDVGYGEMEPKREGGRVVEHAASFDNTPEPDAPQDRGGRQTPNEARTYARLKELMARRRGVQVELIL